MALRDGDGFDHYGGSIANMFNGVATDHNNSSLVTSNVRTGTHALFLPARVTNESVFHRRTIPGPLMDTAGMAFGMYIDTLPQSSSARYIGFLDVNASMIASFSVLTDGRVRVWRGGPSGTLLGESVLPVITSETYQHIQFKVARHATVGSIGLKINNVEVDGCMLENVNTAGGSSNISQVYWGGSSPTTSMGTWIDDYLCWDALGDDNNDWVGDQQLIWRPPTADHPTMPIEYVPSTGSTLWDLIDEASPSATDYIRALDADKQAAFEYANLPTEITDVIGVIPYLFAKKLNSGTCTVNLGMLSNSVVGDAIYQATSPDIQLTTVDTFWRAILERNPDTDLPWTPAEIDAAYLYLDRTA